MAQAEPTTPTPDRETAGGGDFAIGKGPDHYGSAPLALQANEDLEISTDVSTAAGGHVFTLTYRSSLATSTKTVYAGGALQVCGAAIASIQIDSPDGHVFWIRTVHGQLLGPHRPGVQTVIGGQTGTPPVISTPNPTLADNETLPPTSIANGTAEAVAQAGANVVPVGAQVNFRFETIGALATTADQLTYVALKGETSGTYYVVAGPQATTAGTFRMPAAEKIDIVTKNADTVAKVMSASWDAWSGV